MEETPVVTELHETPGVKREITTSGLPVLQGGFADVAAAESIRAELLMAADDYMTSLRQSANLNAPLEPQPRIHDAERALAELREQTGAEWWLQQRGRSIREILGI